jgi:hypothetical protein
VEHRGDAASLLSKIQSCREALVDLVLLLEHQQDKRLEDEPDWLNLLGSLRILQDRLAEAEKETLLLLVEDDLVDQDEEDSIESPRSRLERARLIGDLVRIVLEIGRSIADSISSLTD